MYLLRINCFDCSIRIPAETVDALGSPSEMSFLYNPEKGVLAIAAGTVQFEGAGKRRGRPPKGMGISLKDKWESGQGCCRIEASLAMMEHLCKALPAFDFSKAYVLRGDFIEKKTISFELAAAEEEENDLYRAALAKKVKRKKPAYPSREEEKEAIRNALRDVGHPRQYAEIQIRDGSNRPSG